MEIEVLEEGRARRWPVSARSATIGRDPRNSVVLSSELVSAFHLELRVTAEGLQVRDLGSRNGTALLAAGQPRPRLLAAHQFVPLAAGDMLLLGGEVEGAVEVQARPGRKGLPGSPDEATRLTRPVALATAEQLDRDAWPLLLQLNRELLDAQGTEALVKVALGKLLALVPAATHATIALFTPRTRLIASCYQQRRQAGPPELLSAEALSRTLLERALVERIVDEQVGLLWQDPLEREAGSRSIRALQLRSVASAPLWVGQEVLGLIQADQRGLVPVALGPDDLERLLLVAGPLALALRNAQSLSGIQSERNRLAVENTRLRGALSRDQRQPRLIGQTPAMQELHRLIALVSPSALPVLILGETGTGKELVARLVHEQSGRRDGPFVAYNVAALPANLVEAELFGVVRGAFTGAIADRPGLFESAHQGTLFLDELGELPLGPQAALLRVLESGELHRLGETRTRRVEVRLLAATNRDLDAAVREGGFRRDLLYRINTVTLRLPPLRERVEDIPLLVAHLLRLACAREGRELPVVSEEVLRLLQSHPWPGNVRQLENELLRALVLTPPGLPLTAEVLSGGPRGLGQQDERQLHAAAGRELPLREAIAAFEREYLRAVLSHHGGNRTHAAEMLEISRQGLQKLLRRHGIQD